VVVEVMGRLVVVGWNDAVEEGRGLECGGRGESRVVERRVIVCEESVVCHRVEGGAVRIWRVDDGDLCLLLELSRTAAAQRGGNNLPNYGLCPVLIGRFQS